MAERLVPGNDPDGYPYVPGRTRCHRCAQWIGGTVYPDWTCSRLCARLYDAARRLGDTRLTQWRRRAGETIFE